MDTIGRVHEILKENNRSLYQLSKACGVCYSTFGAASKRNGQLSVDTIEKICQAVGISTYEFFMTDADWENLDKYCRARSDIHEHRIINPIQT